MLNDTPRPKKNSEGSPRRQQPARGKAGRRGGFTMVELLIGMTLLAMILTTVALAMQGATATVAYGNEKSRSQMMATLALDRLRTDLRRADKIELVSPAHVVGLAMADGKLKGYSWGGTDGDPLIYTDDNSLDGNTMVADVVEFTLTSIEKYSAIRKKVVTVNVHIVLEVRYGQATTRLETTVRPRRNIM